MRCSEQRAIDIGSEDLGSSALFTNYQLGRKRVSLSMGLLPGPALKYCSQAGTVLLRSLILALKTAGKNYEDNSGTRQWLDFTKSYGEA